MHACSLVHDLAHYHAAFKKCGLTTNVDHDCLLYALFIHANGAVQPWVHFSGKAEAWEVIKALPFPIAASVEAPCYFQNFSDPAFPLLGFDNESESTATFSFPLLHLDDRVAAFDVNDYGA